jgi:tricorn protease
MEKMLKTSEMRMSLVPKEEWKQVFTDAWRIERDYFYDKNMHGLDWKAVKGQYEKLLDDAQSREDVNYVIGELIGEMSASHTYRGGGDEERAERLDIGYLGIDWGKKEGKYYIKHIVKGASWDIDLKSPMDVSGVEVKEGDYILAVNGIPLESNKEPYHAFQGLSGKTVELTVNSQPVIEGSRKILVETISNEAPLRHLEWIESNRKAVDAASDGKIGYIYVQSTGVDGLNQLARQFYGQWHKDALIIDERFNNGGMIPDRFVEMLNRKPLAFWAVRDGKDWQWPQVANFGPKAMLINGWSGSGGDAFPDYFKKSGAGPLIGTRTWGGLIGITGTPSLIDGGYVTAPTFRMYDPDGKWFKEGYGVDPDIEVKEDPAQLAKGKDMQILKAVEVLMEQLKTKPYVYPKHLPYEKR